MRVASAQFRSQPGNVSANVAAMVRLVRQAAEQGCESILFPEMSDTGYHMPTILETASAWDVGPMLALSEAAKQYKLHVVAGLSEREGDDVYNTTAVISPQGTLLAKYRKVHLITAEPVCEHHSLKPGNSFTLCDIGPLRCGLMTCYDIRFPEMARKLTLSGAEVLIIPSAFPLIRLEHWKTILRCRAIENQVYVIAANRVGTDHGLSFCGNSCLIDPYGTILASASEIDDALLIGEVTKERVIEVRQRMKVLQDRQPELY
jgi:omega-amidase